MDERTKEILNWLDEKANKYSLRLDKVQKRLAEDAIKIIAKSTLSPVEDIPKFNISPELDNATGYIPGVDQPLTGGNK